MSLAYTKVTQEVLNLLGAILGATPTIAEGNYTATPSTSTVIGPDFLSIQASDAIFAAQAEIVEAIACTPLHPERTRFADVTTSLANRAAIPRVGISSATKQIIGVPGVVKDASTSKACLPAPLDAIRSFNEFTNIYTGFTPHWYAINSGRIEHTRTNVILEVCVWDRPISASGNIEIDDHHEGGLVQGAVAKLALKESLFQPLYDAANAVWMAHIANIRSYGQPEIYGKAQAAPSST